MCNTMKTSTKEADNTLFTNGIESLLQGKLSQTNGATQGTIADQPTTSENSRFTLPATTPDLEFLIPEDTHTFQEELYSVEQGELKPITSPFLIPGIYKKIGAEASYPTLGRPIESPHIATNVFLSKMEPHGRIVELKEFEYLYDRERPLGDMNDRQQPPRVVLKEGVNSPPKVPAKAMKKPPAPLPVYNLDALSKFSYDLLQFAQRDRIVIDRSRQEITRTQYGTNLKTIYRFFSPPRLGLHSPLAERTPQLVRPQPKKRGRPRKCPTIPVNQENLAISPKCEELKNFPPPEADTIESNQPELRTRSGRLIKVLQPDLMPSRPATDAKSCQIPHSTEGNHESPSATQPPPPVESEEIAATEPEGNKRRVPPEAVCPTCHKIFLGRRLRRHFAQHPDHMIVPAIQPAQVPTATSPPPPPPASEMTNLHDCTALPAEEKTLFRFLVEKLQKCAALNDDQRAELFLSEISDLVQQLQLRSSRLIRNTSGLHMVSPRVARVLGIPEGQYALDLSAIEAPPELELPINFANLPVPGVSHHRGLDYPTISVSLDDTLTDEAVQKLNLSAGGKLLPPSEESLLRAVDDFVVRDGMAKLSSANLLPPSGDGGMQKPSIVVPHYDHASDNAVEAVTMKETPNHVQQTLDFFQFNNN